MINMTQIYIPGFTSFFQFFPIWFFLVQPNKVQKLCPRLIRAAAMGFPHVSAGYGGAKAGYIVDWQ